MKLLIHVAVITHQQGLNLYVDTDPEAMTIQLAGYVRENLSDLETERREIVQAALDEHRLDDAVLAYFDENEREFLDNDFATPVDVDHLTDHGVTVAVGRSNADNVLLVQIDGPSDGDLDPHGAPRMRIALNDGDIYQNPPFPGEAPDLDNLADNLAQVLSLCAEGGVDFDDVMRRARQIHTRRDLVTA